MGQVNVNTPGDREPVGEPPGSTGMGMILGIIIAILVIAALVYFLVLRGPSGGGDTTNTDGGGEVEPQPSGWMISNRA